MYTVKVKDKKGRYLHQEEVYELFNVRKNPHDRSGMTFQVTLKRFKPFVNAMIENGCTIEIIGFIDQ